MQITDKQIQSFLNGSCDKKTSVKVQQLLKDDPDLLNRFLNKKEWDLAEDNVTEDEEFFDDQWTGIQHRLKRQKRPIKVLYYAAAVLTLCVFVTYFLTRQDSTNTTSLASFKVQKIINNGSHSVLFFLPDSSRVILSANSTIHFSYPFQNQRRTIYLMGSASFKVARDTTMPFSVHTSSLVTTALGTEFEVREYENQSTTIKLFHGKVQIVPADPRTMAFQKQILDPGEQLEYNANRSKISVSRFNQNISKRTIKPKPSALPDRDEALPNLNFQKQPLTAVFKELKKAFGVKIDANRSQTDSIILNADFTNIQSLDQILFLIQQANNISIENKGNNHYIVK